MQNEFLPLFYTFHFYLFGLVALVGAITFVTRKSPVAAAMWLVVTTMALAVLYVLLGAEFVGMMQVLVNAGAIMVVFLFVVMLLNLGHPSELSDIRGKWGRLAAGFLGLALIADLMAISRTTLNVKLSTPAVPAAEIAAGPAGIIGPVAGPMFGGVLFAINIVLMGVIHFLLDRGRLISPAYSRLARADVDALRNVSRIRNKLAGRGA